MAMQKQEEINWLRGFAAFLVVLGHSIIVFPVNLHEIPWCKYLYDTIYSFHMPLFFAISGYCFSMRGGYCSYLIKKAKRLLIPYFIFAFGGLIPRMVLPGLVNGNEPIGTSILKIFFTGGEYWFLYTLFIIFAVFPLIVNALQKNKWIALLSVLVFGVISKWMPNYLCLPLVMYYLVPFTVGYVARQQNVFRLKETTGNLTVTRKLLIVAAICSAILVCGYLHGKFDIATLNLIEAFIGIAGCFVITLIIPMAFKNFGKYSEYSLALYLLDGYFLVVSRILAVNVLKLNNPILIIAINMIIDFYISYLLIRYILSRIPVIRNMIGIA